MPTCAPMFLSSHDRAQATLVFRNSSALSRYACSPVALCNHKAPHANSSLKPLKDLQCTADQTVPQWNSEPVGATCEICEGDIIVKSRVSAGESLRMTRVLSMAFNTVNPRTR